MRTTQTADDASAKAPGGPEPLLELVGVKKHFPITRGIILQRKIGQVHAVDGVDLEVYPGETVGIVGETGCGKSTSARLITKLLEPTEGKIRFEGRDITGPNVIGKPSWFGGFLVAAFLATFVLLIAGLASGWPAWLLYVALGAGAVLLLSVVYTSVVGAVNGWRGTRFNRRIRGLRRDMAMIFQDPYASLNPRKTVGSIIGEPLQIHGIIPGSDIKRPSTGELIRRAAVVLALLGVLGFILGLATELFPAVVGVLLILGGLALGVVGFIFDRVRLRPWRLALKQEVQRLMELVGLNPEHYNRFPHEFSGGQRQRIGVARALTLRPRLIVCDEPVSALDVSIQAQILNLLEDLQEEFNLTYVFIAHDLSVVKHMSDRVSVMYLGKIVEIAPGTTLYENPKHPYTGALLSAVPIPDPRLSAQKNRIVLEGDVPSPIDPPSGCRFHPRCPRAQFPTCRDIVPELAPHHRGQLAACHFPLEDRSVIQSSA